MTKQLDQYKNLLDNIESKCFKLEQEYKKAIRQRDDMTKKYKKIAGLDMDAVVN